MFRITVVYSILDKIWDIYISILFYSKVSELTTPKNNTSQIVAACHMLLLVLKVANTFHSVNWVTAFHYSDYFFYFLKFQYGSYVAGKYGNKTVC